MDVQIVEQAEKKLNMIERYDARFKRSGDPESLLEILVPVRPKMGWRNGS